MRILGQIGDTHIDLTIDLLSSEQQPEKEILARAPPTVKPFENDEDVDKAEIRAAIKRLQEKGVAVNVSRILEETKGRLIRSVSKQKRLATVVMQMDGVKKTCRPRRDLSVEMSEEKSPEIEIRRGEITCPQDGKEHIMEFCTISGEDQGPCPHHVSREIDSSGNGRMLCRYPAEKEGAA